MNHPRVENINLHGQEQDGQFQEANLVLGFEFESVILSNMFFDKPN